MQRRRWLACSRKKSSSSSSSNSSRVEEARSKPQQGRRQRQRHTHLRQLRVEGHDGMAEEQDVPVDAAAAGQEKQDG